METYDTDDKRADITALQENPAATPDNETPCVLSSAAHEDVGPEEMHRLTEEEARRLCETHSEEELRRMAEEVLQQTGQSAERDARLQQARQEEHAKRVTSFDLPLDYVNAYAQSPQQYCDDMDDALVMCIATLGYVDMEYIAAVARCTPKETVLHFRGTGVVYQDPEKWGECYYKGWVTADEYLSGNVLRKYEQAQAATDKYLGYFDDNVAALEPLLPVRIPANQIYFTLGSPWIPDDLVNDFVVALLRLKYRLKDGVTHDSKLNRWVVRYGDKFSSFGTAKMPATEIIERTLNNMPVTVYDSVPKPGYSWAQRKFERKVNEAETALAREKQKLIVTAFDNYVRNDDKRMERLQEIFYRRYGCIKARRYNGRFLSLPDKNPLINMYPHQKDAVARIIYSRSTLLAHSVGTGKTYIMIAACMEMRRMGLSHKNLFVVPNNILGQWQEAFATLYPKSRVYVVYPHDFRPAQRQNVLRRIRDEDYDAVVMAYTTFGAIPVGLRRVRAELRHKWSALPDKPQYAAERRSISEKLAHIDVQIANEAPGIKFEDLRINSLFVDEAHNFKNITLSDGYNFFGNAGSARCDDMHLKIRVLCRYKGCKSVVFATGTPITNSITDMYVMQTYLQPAQLRMLGLETFDEWALMFGEKSEDFEIDVDAVNYRMCTRFNKFHNLPELTNIFAEVADFHLQDNEQLFAGTVSCHNVVVHRSAEQVAYIQSLAKRAEDIRAHNSAAGDNLLKVTSDGRRAALDYRLVEPYAPAAPHSKAQTCSEYVYRIWQERPLCTQVVFCDVSTPKIGFNMYDEMRDLLVAKGIPAQQIAFVHNADSEQTRRQLFAAVNDGTVRVLIGSTFKLGTGVNIQKRLYAVHHLDVPWRPADMVQREGRMLRQGNVNDDVEIYRYITEGSFDAYSWQLLESKQRFISQLLYNSLDRRDGEELDDLTLSYSQIKALAINNPIIKERVETANKLVRLLLLEKSKAERQVTLQTKLQTIPSQIEGLKKLVACCKKDHGTYQKHRGDAVSRRTVGEQIQAAIALDIARTEDEVVAQYKGFALVIPATLVYNNPVLIVRGAHDWRFNIDFSPLGIMAKVDHVLEGFVTRAENLRQQIHQLTVELDEAQAELERKDNLAQQIDDTRRYLAQLDAALGVNKDE